MHKCKKLLTIGVIRDDLSIASESSGDEEESLVPAICLSALTGAATWKNWGLASNSPN